MSVNEKKILLKMAKVLLTDCQSISQRGAGYYSTSPFVITYNKLLEKAKVLFGEDSSLLDTFSEIPDSPSTDPAIKEKTTQGVIIEGGQLVAFIEAVLEQQAEKEEPKAADTAAD